MGLQAMYQGLEDKYYSGLDWLDKHGIPVYSVVDAIEAQNIPSFPIAALVTLLVVGVLAVVVSPILLGGNATLTVLVQDDTQTPLKGIAVQLSGNGLSGDALNQRLTNEDGVVTFTNLPIGTTVTISASYENYSIDEKSIVLDQGENEKKLTAIALAVTKSISLQLYKSNSTETFNAAIPLSFSCSGDETFSKTSTVAGGQISLDVPPACGTLSVVSLDDTLTLQNAVVDVDDANPRIYINAQPSGNAVLRVTLLNESGNGVAGLTTMLKSKFGDVLATKFSDATGFVEFAGLAPDTYTIFVQSDGTHAELDSGNIEVNDAQPVEKTLTIPLASVGEVRVQFVDEGNLSPVSGARVTLSRGNQVISTKTTNDGGQVTFSVSSPNNLSVGVDHPSYLVRASIAVSVSTAGYTTIPLAKATLQNSQIVTVKVVDELNLPVENAYVALKKSPSGASVGTNKITGASGTVQFTSLEEGTYFASAYKPGFSDQIKSELFSVRARENVESTIKLVIGNGTISFSVKDTVGQALAGATIQAVDAATHNAVGNELATNVDGTAELTLRADRYVYFVIDEPNHLPYVTLPVQVKKSITQNVSAELVKDISKLEIKTLSTSVNGKPILEESGLAPGQTYTVRFALMVPRNTAYTETGVHIRTGNSSDGTTNPIENDGWFIRDVRGAFAKVQKGTTYTPPAGLGIDAQHVTSGEAKWANIVFSPAHEGLTIVEADITVKDTTIQGADLPLYYRAWGKTGSYVRFPVDAVLGGSESVAQKQGLYANANVKLYSTGASTHVCTKDFCLGLVGEDLANGLQTSLLDDMDADISSKQKILFTFTSVSDAVFADTSLILQSTTSSATLNAYDVTNAVGAKKTGVVSGNKVEIPIGTIQKNNVVFGFVNMDASKEGTSRVKFSLVSSKKEVYSRELLVSVSAAGEMNVELVPKAILPLLTNQLLVHVTQGASGDEAALENATVTIALNGTLLTSGFTDGEGVFPFELNEPNVSDIVEITAEKQGHKPLVLRINVGADIVSFIPAQLNESLIVNGTTRKTRDVHMLNLASIPLEIKDVSLSGDFGDLVKFDLLNEEIVGETLGVNQDRNVTVAFSLTEKGQNLLAAKTLKGSVLVKLSSATSEKTFTNALPVTLKVGFGGEVDVEDCLLVEPVQWDVYADPKEVKQQAFEIRNTCTVKAVPVKLTNLSAKIKQLSGDTLGVFTLVSNEKTTELGSTFKTILTSIPAGGEVVVTTSFSPDQILSGMAAPQLIFQATNMTDNGTPDLVEETVKINLVVNALAKCVQVKTPSVLEIDSCAINTGMGNMGSYYNQIYQPTGVPYYNPSYSTLNNTTNPSGSSLLPSSVSGGQYGSYNYGNGYFSPQYGASGYDALGGYQANGSTFSGGAGYSSMQGYYANPYVDKYNYSGSAGGMYGCGGSEIRIENSCQSEIEIQLDADPNVYVSKSAAVLKPNQTERIRVGAGYRIGKYPVYINARANGSKDASLEVGIVDVLIKSPTEVNGDCITINSTKYRFNDLLQKPVKGKVTNKCYNSGVRLVPSADTITIASYFTVDDEVTFTEKGSVKSRPNTMAHDIQLIGVQTRGSGRDTVQELEFQIFPDFETYKRVLSPFTEGGGIGKQLLDLKLFLEGQYYRAESYGTISVKYLDAYGGSQQKPFPVIFENLWRIGGVLDIGDGNPALTDFQQCINEDALVYESVSAQTGNKNVITLNDNDFKGDNGTILTTMVFVPSAENKVLKVGDAFCGGRDSLTQLQTRTLTSSQNPAVKATFSIVGGQNIQAEVSRPATLNTDAVIEGNLELSVTRTAFQVSTKKVIVPVKIIVTKPGKAIPTAAFQPAACSIDGYAKGSDIRSLYGFDKLTWDWTWERSPDCSEQFCDGTQFTTWMLKRVEKFNQMIVNIKGTTEATSTVFSDTGKTYDTLNFLPALVETQEITDDSTTNPTKITLVINTSGGILEAPPSSTLSQWKADAKNLLKLDEDNAEAYVKAVDIFMNEAKSKYPSLYAGTVLVFDAAKVDKTPGLGQALQTWKAEKIVTPVKIAGKSVEKYVWTMGEYLSFHQKVQLDIADDPPAGAPLTATPGTLRAIGESLEDVVVGYVWNESDAALKNDASVRKYVLTNAKLKYDKWYAPFGSAEEVLDTFLDTHVYLVDERFGEDLFDDYSMHTLAPHAYAGVLQQKGIPASFVKGIQFRDTKESVQSALTPLRVDAGKYPVSIYLSWKASATGNFVLESVKPFVDTKTYTPLAEIATENGAVLDYEKNPFFHIAFNGTTGVDSGRNQYGSTVGYRADGTLFMVKGNPLQPLTWNPIDSMEGIASFVQTANAPAFASLANNTLTLAPSVPVPLNVRVSNGSNVPALQYYFISPSLGGDTPISLSASPIWWNDCTSASSAPASVTLAPTCSANPSVSQSIVGNTVGSELFYRGIALVPTQKAYHLKFACADETATVKSLLSTPVAVDMVQSTNTQAIPLTNASVTKVSTLAGALDQVYKGDACAQFDAKTFSIIWDITSPHVMPAGLQCSAASSSP